MTSAPWKKTATCAKAGYREGEFNQILDTILIQVPLLGINPPLTQPTLLPSDQKKVQTNTARSQKKLKNWELEKGNTNQKGYCVPRAFKF